MDWNAVGAVAEFLGAAATVATLAYLAVQIRQASATTRAQIRQAIADSQVHYVNSRAIDPFLRRTSHRAFLGEELSPEERYGLRAHLIAHLRLFENYYAQHALGTMEAEDWRAQRELMKALLRNEAYREAYSLFGQSVWNSGFAAEVEGILAGADGQHVSGAGSSAGRAVVP